LTAETVAQPVHFRRTGHSHGVTRICNVSGGSLAAVLRHAVKTLGLICALTLGKFIGEQRCLEKTN
jgi:hypothetical protein